MQDFTNGTIILRKAFSGTAHLYSNLKAMINNIRKVLVPVNGTKVDEAAIKLACRLAKEAKGKIYVTYVIQVDRTLPLDAEIKPEIEKGERVLDKAEHIAEEQNYKVETDLLQAREVGPAIVDEAIERGVDLVIIGISYKTKFGGFSLGSTVPYVLKNAPCWVLICREPIPGEGAER
ncbi:MAG: universal stress protein [Chloroflexi bacterium]|nr:universal stress protein [Chloroflexota bacterium]